MTDRDQDRLIEIVLTSVLLLLATALFGGASLGPYRLFLIAGLLGGFSFAWYMREKEQPATKYFLTVGALSVLVWFIVSVANSTLLYRDVVLICIKGLIFIEVVLSFDIHLLPYMQLLCIPLYMCFPFFFQGQMEPLLMLTAFFNILAWFILLKMKLYNFLNVPLSKIWSRRHIPILSLVILLLLSLSLGWILFIGLRLDSMRKGGLFLVEEIDLKGSSSQTEQTFYDLQDKLIKEMSDVIEERPSLQDKYEMMNQLDVLVKKTEDSKQVRKAATGLVSHLKIEGPGLKELAEKTTLTILKEYVNAIIKYQLSKKEEEMRKSLQKTPLDIKRGMTTSALVKKMNSSSSPEEVAKHEKELQKTIQSASINTKLKKERMDLVRKMKEWKSFELSKWEALALPMEKMPLPQEKEQKKVKYKDYAKATPVTQPLTPEQRKLIAKAEALKEMIPPESLTPEQQELIAQAEALKEMIPPESLTPEQQELIAQAEALKEMVTPPPLTLEQQELIAQAEALKEMIPPESLTPEQQELIAQAEALKEMIPPESLTPEQQELIAQAEALKEMIPPESLTPEQQELIAQAEALKEMIPPESLTPEQQELIAQAEALKEMIPPESLTPEQQELIAQAEALKATSTPELLNLEQSLIDEQSEFKPRLVKRSKAEDALERRLLLISRLIWKLFILFLLILLILIGLFIWLLVLYFRTQKRKKEIMALYHSHTNEFIIHLNENIKGVLALFGLPYKKTMPPLHYADFIEGKCLIENKIFKRFTIKFEEAKYSRHLLKSEDALTALDGYNGLLKTLFSGCHKSILAMRYILGLIQTRPFLMPDKPEVPR